jgi:hypothetical protein
MTSAGIQPSAGPRPAESPAASLPGASQALEELCSCGHVLAGHDPVSARFCEATNARQLTRSCICSSGKAVPASR